MGWEGRKRRGRWEGGEGEGRGGERGEDAEGPGKWSAPGPVLALGAHDRLYSLQKSKILQQTTAQTMPSQDTGIRQFGGFLLSIVTFF